MTTDWTIGVRFLAEAKEFSSSLCVQSSTETHPVSYLMGTRGFFPGDKERPGRDANHSPHLVQRAWMSSRLSSLPLRACMALAGKICCLFYISSRLQSRPSERRGRVMKTYGSYSGDPWFKSRHGARLSCQRLFVDFLSSSRRMLG
jgi:hypothetical protein